MTAPAARAESPTTTALVGGNPPVGFAQLAEITSRLEQIQQSLDSGSAGAKLR